MKWKNNENENENGDERWKKVVVWWWLN